MYYQYKVLWRKKDSILKHQSKVYISTKDIIETPVYEYMDEVKSAVKEKVQSEESVLDIDFLSIELLEVFGYIDRAPDKDYEIVF